MKHFRIQFFIGNSGFEFCCMTMHEAYEAISDIAVTVADRWGPRWDPDMDKIMETLVEMKKGHMLTAENDVCRIAYVDGEV